MGRSTAWSCRASRLLVLGMLVFQVTSAKSLQANDEVTPAVQNLYAQAKAAEQRGDITTAVGKYQAMIKLAPHLAAAYNNLGMLYFNERDYAHASEVLEHGLKINPKMPTASALLGMSYFQLGENDKAEPLLRTALHANPTDNHIEMILVHILINGKRFGEATSLLNSYLERNPKDQEAWYLLGKTYMQMSEDALAKVHEIDPNSVVAHEIAGEIDSSMHNYDLALVEYKKAIDLAPQMPGTHMHMGDAYWYIGKWQSAETEFKAELANDPNNCMAHWKLGNSILEANDPTEEALPELNRAIEQCPTLMQARVDRARALIRMGKQVDALPDLVMAEKESPRAIHSLPPRRCLQGAGQEHRCAAGNAHLRNVAERGQRRHCATGK